MTICSITEKQNRPIEIDLTGPDGNAFVLIGYATKWAKQLGEGFTLLHGITPTELQEEMMSGSYEDLIDTLEKYFGPYITLYR